MNDVDKIRSLFEKENLLRTFAYYLEQVKFNPESNPNVIDIGCGKGIFEGFLCLNLLYKMNYGLDIQFTGNDLTEEKYAVSKDRMKTISDLFDVPHFIPGDAQSISRLVTDKYGLILFQNPDVEPEEQRNVLERILIDVKNIATPQTLVFMTHFHERYHRHLVDIITKLNYPILVNETNRFPGKIITKENECQHYKYVLIASLPKTPV